MRFNQLQDWLSWQESLHSSAIDMGLERVRCVAERMQLLQPAAQVVSVAGTNGKGSCVATLEALCLQQGVRVGAFTSPHLNVYNERIRVDGQLVEDHLICESFERIDQARGDISLTYFEFGTLAAIDVFQQQGVEVMLLEVGLGGRLDAVNIIDADVAVVTSIALDHQDWLGSDLEVIGREKAGIYRNGRWAICADRDAPASVADCAHDVGAYWLAMGMSMNLTLASDGNSWDWAGVTVDGEGLSLEHLPVPQLPLTSVVAALQAFVLLGYGLPEDIADLLGRLTLPGRAQRVHWQQRDWLLDVAHNPAAATHLAALLRRTPVSGETHCLVAMMSDKDRSGVFETLLNQIDHWHLADLADNPRAATAAQLQVDLRDLGETATCYESVKQAMTLLAGEIPAADRVVVMGSFFTVAEALSLLGEDQQCNHNGGKE